MLVLRSVTSSTKDSSAKRVATPAAIGAFAALRRSLTSFRIKCPYFLFILSVGAGLLGSRAGAQADGGTGPNWECAADSASTAALIYLHCSAPPPPFPVSFPYLPLPLSTSLHSDTAILEHGSGTSWRETEGVDRYSLRTRSLHGLHVYMIDSRETREF